MSLAIKQSPMNTQSINFGQNNAQNSPKSNELLKGGIAAIGGATTAVGGCAVRTWTKVTALSKFIDVVDNMGKAIEKGEKFEIPKQYTEFLNGLCEKGAKAFKKLKLDHITEYGKKLGITQDLVKNVVSGKTNTSKEILTSATGKKVLIIGAIAGVIIDGICSLFFGKKKEKAETPDTTETADLAA